MNILLFAWLITCIAGMKHTFLMNNEGWCVRQTKEKVCEPAKHYEYNTGVLNRYIGGKDTLINVDGKNKDDRDLWYFVLPSRKQNMNLDKGPYALTFSMTSFMGDFKKMNAGVRDRAIIIRTNTSEYWLSLFEDYDGTPKTYWIPFHVMTIRKKENDGTFLDMSNRDLPKMLKNIQEIAILGDWTQGIEMIGLDNVAIEAML